MTEYLRGRQFLLVIEHIDSRPHILPTVRFYDLVSRNDERRSRPIQNAVYPEVILFSEDLNSMPFPKHVCSHDYTPF